MGRKLRQNKKKNEVKQLSKKRHGSQVASSDAGFKNRQKPAEVKLELPNSIKAQNPDSTRPNNSNSKKPQAKAIQDKNVQHTRSPLGVHWVDETREEFPELSELSEDAKLFQAAVEQVDSLVIMEKKASALDDRSDLLNSNFKDRNRSLSRGKFSKKKKNIKQFKIDLHGLILSEALKKVEQLIEGLNEKGEKVEVIIVTGKGIGSPGGPVLAGEVWRFVKERYGLQISYLDSSPMETILGGLPLRGYFRVILHF